MVEKTLEVVGGKWKPVIIWHLIHGTKRFGQLRKLMPGVTQQMLTTHLRELERHGVVHRRVYAEVPPKVEYSATTVGMSLLPLLELMHEWGKEYASACPQANSDT